MSNDQRLRAIDNRTAAWSFVSTIATGVYSTRGRAGLMATLIRTTFLIEIALIIVNAARRALGNGISQRTIAFFICKQNEIKWYKYIDPGTSIRIYCINIVLKAMWNTLSVQESAREIASVALSAEQERHTKCVSPRLKAEWNTFVCLLSCSAESATEALSLALHSVPRVFHLALRRG